MAPHTLAATFMNVGVRVYLPCMDSFLGVFFFLLGLCMGSFFNVVLYRYRSGRTLSGRSACTSCGVVLSPVDLVPLLSFLFLAGRCRSCASRISLQYPAVEALTGFLYLGVYAMGMSLPETVFWLFVASFSVLILVYDVRHLLIPDGFSYPFIALGVVPLIFSFIPPALSIAPLSEWLAGPLLALPLFLLWLFSRGAWFGLGDAKLMLGIGFLLGFSRGAAALLISFWIGAAVGVALLLWSWFLAYGAPRFFGSSRLFRKSNHFTMKSELPFAPFLLVGLFAVFFLHLDLSAIILFLSHVPY